MKILVIDIGGTFVKYAFMKEDTTVFSKGKVKTPTKDRAQLVETIGKLYDSEPNVSGIAISMPGIIDSENGYIVMGGGILHYNDDFYLGHALEERCGVKVCLDNDAKCAAMAEASAGALKDVRDGFVLIFGTMIGGAFIKDHKLHKGRHFSAGEVSYIQTARDGIPNADSIWGNRCGTPYLCKLYAERKNLNPDEVDGIKVFDAVHKQEPEALESLNIFAREIAVQIFNLQTILDPQRFAIGGGISAQPIFIEYIKNNLNELYAGCSYHVPHAEVVSCKFENDANLIGALESYLAMYQKKD